MAMTPLPAGSTVQHGDRCPTRGVVVPVSGMASDRGGRLVVWS